MMASIRSFVADTETDWRCWLHRTCRPLNVVSPKREVLIYFQPCFTPSWHQKPSYLASSNETVYWTKGSTLYTKTSILSILMSNLTISFQLQSSPRQGWLKFPAKCLTLDPHRMPLTNAPKFYPMLNWIAKSTQPHPRSHPTPFSKGNYLPCPK